MNSKALVILSGGQDSTTCLFWALARYEEVHAITFDYGQRHIRELEAAHVIANIAGVANRHEICALGSEVLKGASPLTSGGELETYSDYKTMDAIIGDRVEKTFVPLRNALFLTIAANRAAVLGDCDLVTGVCQADNANYPDCRQNFIYAQHHAIAEALGHTGINIETPLMNMSKAQSIDLAYQLGCYPVLAWSHTAYSGEFPPITQDHATVLRAEGFRQAGLPDPLIVRAWMLQLLPTLPEGYPSANDYRIVDLTVQMASIAKQAGLWA